jgi:hypothetical protein
LVQDQPQATSGRPVEKIIKTKNEWEQGWSGKVAA